MGVESSVGCGRLSTMSYLILPHLTTSYPVSPLSYVEAYCHPTLDSTPSYIILPQILLRFYPVLPYPNHILPCQPFVYPILRCVLLPSYPGFYPVLPYPTTSNHILPFRTFLPHPTV